ncbi:MAG: hypothetical protein KC442_09575 [Thermomicrobiales bacterium]|nr:hypothetical protein [Thermomicrobiales bacterium]
MDDARFDEMARGLEARLTRRHAGGLATGALLALGLAMESEAKKKKKKKKCKPAKVCNGKCGVVTCQKKRFDCGPCGPSGECDVCASGCAHQTVQAAIDTASSGDTITICAGTYTRPTSGANRNVALIRGKNLTLVGAGAEQTILDGGGVATTQMVVAVQNTATASPVTVKLQNMTVTGANGSPGMVLGTYGVLVSGAGNSLTLEQVTVRNNTTSGIGGGIGVSEGSLLLGAGTQVRNNSAGSHGGGIYTDGTLTVNDGATVRDNQSGASGGGIYNDGTLTLNNGARVSGNAATAGGGIYNFFGNVTLVVGSEVCANTPNDCAGSAGGYSPAICSDTPVCLAS